MSLMRRWFRRIFRPLDVIVIRGLTPPQREAVESLLATWQSLGSLGSSRWTAFYADGDGNFRPRCYINGHRAKHTTRIPKDQLWRHGEYRIDFDAIAWRLHAENRKAQP